MEEFLTSLLRSLNEIEVKGKQNIDILLGCMMAIETKIKQLGEEEGEDGG